RLGDAAAAAVDRLLTRRRLRGYLAIFLAVWVATLLASVAFGHPPRNMAGKPILPDFLAHWIGGRLLLDGQTVRLYDPDVQHALQTQVVGEQDALAWFVNPPFMAFFYAPFAALPYLPSALAWTLF